MRFEQLLLRAFGPFTDLTLDLSGGAPGGLHVIYGPNEAGKSTSLRGVKNFLFGMPQRSVDAHLHPSPKLALGGIVSEGEHRYELLRLKRKKDNLVALDGSPLLENPLPSLLGHLDEKSFASRFGLDQVELEKGAEALLGGSEEGLFSAGTAGADARRVLDTLEAECSALFLQRGKNPLLNKQSADFENASREAKRAERPPEKWLEQERAFREASERARRVRKERSEVRIELRRLNRLHSVISDLNEWEAKQKRLQELQDVVQLPADAREKREAVLSQRAEAQVEARRIREELTAFEQELQALPAESPLAEVDDVQMELSARVGTAISARKDMPKRRAALLEQERHIEVLLRDLGREVEASDALKVARQVLTGEETAGAVRRLVAQRSGLRAEVEEAERALRKLSAELKELSGQEEGQGAAGNLVRLDAELHDARSSLSLEAEMLREEKLFAEEAVRLHALRSQCKTEASFIELQENLPTVAAVRSSVERYREDCRSEENMRAELERVEQKERQTQAQTEASADLPSEEQLSRARQQRDQLLGNLLEEQKLGSLTSEAHAQSLGALDAAISQADQLADRLRLEAERVAEAQAYQRQLKELKAQAQVWREKLAAVVEKKAQSQQRYEQLCGRLKCTQSPELTDAVDWISSLHELCVGEKSQKMRAEQLEKQRRLIKQAQSSLAELLGSEAAGLGLAGAIAFAERSLREGLKHSERKEVNRKRVAQLIREKDEASFHLEQVQARANEWQGAWADAVAPLGLKADASIERAQEVLNTLERIGRIVDVATNLEGRITGMNRDTEALERDVSKVAAHFLPSLLEEEDPVDRAQRLQEAIRSSRRVAEERARLRRLIAERRHALLDSEGRLEKYEQSLAYMMASARVKTVPELEKSEEASREKLELVGRLQQLEGRIHEASDGASLEELRSEAQEWQGAVRRLVARIDEVDTRGTELDDELRDAESDVEGTRLGLDTYRDENVALARQVATEKAATAQATLHEYLVLKTAQTLLQEQVERYAAQFSGPIAGRAGELFQRITLGKYSGLSIGLGERTLRCIRSGHEIEVSELSRGTRAQLYFVLRLASLENYFSQHPAVPLVFDDLFVDFDDDRTSVAFELLAEMAQKVQILYFTHLARDVEKAHDAVPADLLFSHTIGVG